MEKIPTTYDLKDRQTDYLERMATAHELPDAGKALRCLIDYAMANPDRQNEIFREMRCVHC